MKQVCGMVSCDYRFPFDTNRPFALQLVLRSIENAVGVTSSNDRKSSPNMKANEDQLQIYGGHTFVTFTMHS